MMSLRVMLSKAVLTRSSSPRPDFSLNLSQATLPLTTNMGISLSCTDELLRENLELEKHGGFTRLAVVSHLHVYSLSRSFTCLSYATFARHTYSHVCISCRLSRSLFLFSGSFSLVVLSSLLLLSLIQIPTLMC